MSLALDDLPRDPDRLLLMLQQMAEVTAGERSRITSLETERDTILAERDAARTERDLIREKHDTAQAEIEKLRLLIRQLQRGQFGRRSERLDPDQLQLGLEDLEQTAAAAEAAQEEVAAKSSTPRPPRVRRRNLGALPVHLPRVEVLVDVEDKSCPCCGEALHVIGEDTSEMLDIVPARLRVKVVRRPRYEPPPLKWSTLRYVFGQEGGPRCRARGTSLRRSSPSCARWMSWSRRGRAWLTPCARSV